MMSVKNKRVAVIGGGVSGIMSIKSFKEEEFEVVCFERSGHIGGLWRYHEDDVDGLASVMSSTVQNTSKEIGAVSNYPPPAEFPNYMHHTLMYKYISMWANEFNCIRHIRFHHETTNIEKADDYEKTGRWKVTNKYIQTGEVMTEIFDCVAVCTGHHVYPNEPTFTNQDEFEGKIMHTLSLKHCHGFENQRVVVVGAGNSGLDAASELSSVAKQVYLSTQRGAWIISRLGPKGYPIDCIYQRRYINFLKYKLPYNLVCRYSEKALNEYFNHALYNIQPKHRIYSQHPSLSDTIFFKLISGAVVVRGNIKQFTHKGVIFEGEMNETEVDSIILATGYDIKFPFLSDDIVSVIDNRIELYKFICPPHMPHSTLGFIGLIQPNSAGLPSMEMQTRWLARLMTGKHNLPSNEKMLRDIKATEEHMHKYYVNSHRHTVTIDYQHYLDDLAKDIGVKPNLFKLAITDPNLFRAVVFGPFLPYQFRLQGPHCWDGARDAILTYKARIVKPYQKLGQPPFESKRHWLESQILKILFLLIILYFFYKILFG